MARKPQTRSRKALRGDCDRLWSKIIRRRDGKCIICGAARTEAHHLIPRQAVFYRHELWNGVALCHACHKVSLVLSPHYAPHGFEAWMREHRPEQWAKWNANRHKVVMGQKMDYEAILERLQYVWDVGERYGEPDAGGEE